MCLVFGDCGRCTRSQLKRLCGIGLVAASMRQCMRSHCWVCKTLLGKVRQKDRANDGEMNHRAQT